MGPNLELLEHARSMQASFQQQHARRCDLIGELAQIADGLRDLSGQFHAEADAARRRLHHIREDWAVAKAKAEQAAKVAKLMAWDVAR